MAINLTKEQVTALAPDASSVAAGEKLIRQIKDYGHGANGDLLFGFCQGSGANPYQIAIDLTAPAFKCNCPSRKFPCKHGLALAFLFCAQKDSFQEKSAPAFAQEWFQKRQAKSSEDKPASAPKTAEEEEVSQAAKEKRLDERLKKIELGLEELERFIEDIFQQGLAHVKTQAGKLFQERAGRLIDAQAPGLARMVGELAFAINSSHHSEEEFLHKVAAIQIILQALKNRDLLSKQTKEDLFSTLGIAQAQEEILRQEGVTDNWFVINQRIYQEDRLRVQRSFLRGEKTKRYALILNFAHGTGAFGELYLPGSWYNGEMVYYKSSVPLRALFKSKTALDKPAQEFSDHDNFADFLSYFANATSELPWLNSLPLSLKNVAAVLDNTGRPWLRDTADNLIPLALSHHQLLNLFAFTGGESFSAFGEWSGSTFFVQSALKGNTFQRLVST
jgi:hypothetical protein